MENRNKNLNWQYPEGQSHDVHMESPATKKQSISPRKRAFRDRSTEDNEQSKETTGPITKRHKLHLTQDEYPTPVTAHVNWKLETNSDGGALLVEDKRIIIGTSDGRVIFLDLEGHVTEQIPLSRPIGALLKSNGRLFAWCHAKKGYEKWKGALVDLSFDSPLVLFDVESFGDHCTQVDMVDGCLALADNNGNIALFGCDGKSLWEKSQPTMGSGGFLLADESGVYVAHKKVVRCYNVDNGDVKWEFRCPGGRQAAISRGYKNADKIYVESQGKVYQLDMEQGQLQKEFQPYRHSGSGVCIGNGLVITGNNPTVIFNQETEKEISRLYIPAKLDSAVMQFPKNRQLYLFWDHLYCLDLTPEGLQKAVDGKYRTTFNHTVPVSKTELKLPALGTLTDSEGYEGVVVTCSVTETPEDQIKVTTDAEGYNDDWPIMFPRDLRASGQQFMVEKLVASELGKFYSVGGKFVNKYVPEVEVKAVEQATSGEKKESEDKESEQLIAMCVSPYGKTA